ncbi:hypothetical protein HETIRDRAFT_317841, partial [Heterobasidion irregulare TC 32-1]
QRNHNFDPGTHGSDRMHESVSQLIDGHSPLGVPQTSICLGCRISSSLSAHQYDWYIVYSRMEASKVTVKVRDDIPIIGCLSYKLWGGL